MRPFTDLAREIYLPLFDKVPVSYSFEHHYHVFKATKSLLANAVVGDSNSTKGVTYLGDGAWGIDHNGQGVDHWYDEMQRNFKHVFIGTLQRVSSGAVQLDVQAIDEKGNVFFQTSKTKQ